jgi:hypothetical protein
MTQREPKKQLYDPVPVTEEVYTTFDSVVTPVLYLGMYIVLSLSLSLPLCI